MTLDFMLADKTFEPVWRTRTRVPFGARGVTVVSRDGLIAMKVRAARPQDLRLREASDLLDLCRSLTRGWTSEALRGSWTRGEADGR